MIGGMIDHCPVARAGQPLEQQRKALLRAVGDHDLVRRGRAAAPVIMGGDRAAQHHQAEGIIAKIAEIGGQRLHCMGIGARDPGRGGQRGMSPVEQIAARRHVRIVRGLGGMARRQARDAARPLPAFQKAFVAQPVEGSGHGGARQAERGRKLAFAGQAHVEADAPVEHQHPQRLGQLPIGGFGAVLRTPGAEQAQQGRRTKRRRGHERSCRSRDCCHLRATGPASKGQSRTIGMIRAVFMVSRGKGMVGPQG